MQTTVRRASVANTVQSRTPIASASGMVRSQEP